MVGGTESSSSEDNSAPATASVAEMFALAEEEAVPVTVAEAEAVGFFF